METIRPSGIQDFNNEIIMLLQYKMISQNILNIRYNLYSCQSGDLCKLFYRLLLQGHETSV